MVRSPVERKLGEYAMLRVRYKHPKHCVFIELLFGEFVFDNSVF
ncbi:hypothetical protein QT998_19890 [Microcoleus sp. S1D4]